MNAKALKDFMENTPLMCHNAQFEAKWLLSLGINPNIAHDTKLMAFLYDNRLIHTTHLRLSELGEVLLNEKILSHGEEICDMTGKELSDQNISHTAGTYLLGEYLWPLLSKPEKRVYKEVLIPATKSLASIELQGLRVDRVLLQNLITSETKRMKELMAIPEFNMVEQLTGETFNPESPKHREILVYEVLGYDCPTFCKTKTGKPSTKKDTLLFLYSKDKNPILKAFMDLSIVSGVLSGTLNPILCDHATAYKNSFFIYPSLWLGETNTGRIRSSHPNMQNFVKDNAYRKIFIPRSNKGIIVDWDYDGIELRILASLADDDRLIEAILSGDPHTATAQDIFNKKDISSEERSIAKTFNYGIVYGARPNTLAINTGITVERAKKLYNRFVKTHECLFTYLDNYVEEGVVYSPTGMKRYYSKQTEANNFPIQNTALIAMLIAMNRVVLDVNSGSRGKIDLTVHDSLRGDIEDKSLIQEVKDGMESVTFPFMRVPLTVSVKCGKNWGELK